MKKVQWAFWNGLYLAAALYMVYSNNAGIANIVIFFALVSGALHSLVYAVYLYSDGMKEIVKKRELDVPLWTDAIYDTVIICVLLYSNHWITALVYAMGFMAHQLTYIKPSVPSTPIVEEK